jgi:hypothetical protein
VVVNQKNEVVRDAFDDFKIRMIISYLISISSFEIICIPDHCISLHTAKLLDNHCIDGIVCLS